MKAYEKCTSIFHHSVIDHLQITFNMYSIEEHYYTVPTRTILKLLGLWHHKKSRFVLLQQMLMAFMVATYVSLQLLTFLANKFSIALFVDSVTFVSPGIIILLKYCFFVLKSKTIKDFHYQMQQDWRIIDNKMENEILLKHAHEVQTLTTVLLCITGIAVSTALFIQFLPIVLDAIVPLDKPRECKFLIPIEYFIFQDEHFYIKLFHEILMIIICTLILIATGMQLLIFLHHSYGLFKLASYRIEFSIENVVLQVSNSIKMEHYIRKRIMLTVIAHRRAMEFSNMITSSFNVQYSILIIIGVVSLSIIFYRFVKAVTVTKNVEDAVVSFIITMGFLLYMYMANYVGQKIKDFNEEVAISVYGISWYLMPVSSQKLILFLQQKTNKDFHLTIGYLFVAKIENFAVLLNSALSYFAMMHSIQ